MEPHRSYLPHVRHPRVVTIRAGAPHRRCLSTTSAHLARGRRRDRAARPGSAAPLPPHRAGGRHRRDEMRVQHGDWHGGGRGPRRGRSPRRRGARACVFSQVVARGAGQGWRPMTPSAMGPRGPGAWRCSSPAAARPAGHHRRLRLGRPARHRGGGGGLEPPDRYSCNAEGHDTHHLPPLRPYRLAGTGEAYDADLAGSSRPTPWISSSRRGGCTCSPWPSCRTIRAVLSIHRRCPALSGDARHRARLRAFRRGGSSARGDGPSRARRGGG